MEYYTNHLVCTGCSRVEQNSFDVGDECCSCGAFVLPVPDDYFVKFDRLGKVANKVSSIMFGDEGALGAEIVSGVETAAETNWTMKSALEVIQELDCWCASMRDQGSICAACIAAEALDKIHAAHRNMIRAVEANIKYRRNLI